MDTTRMGFPVDDPIPQKKKYMNTHQDGDRTHRDTETNRNHPAKRTRLSERQTKDIAEWSRESSHGQQGSAFLPGEVPNNHSQLRSRIHHGELSGRQSWENSEPVKKRSQFIPLFSSEQRMRSVLISKKSEQRRTNTKYIKDSRTEESRENRKRRPELHTCHVPTNHSPFSLFEPMDGGELPFQPAQFGWRFQ